MDGRLRIFMSKHGFQPSFRHWFLIFRYFTGAVDGLKDVHVDVPVAVREGGTAVMRCDYDLEQEALYTVKWYKGRREFFRFVPKELPHTRVFPLATINVDVSDKHIFFQYIVTEPGGERFLR